MAASQQEDAPAKKKRNNNPGVRIQVGAGPPARPPACFCRPVDISISQLWRQPLLQRWEASHSLLRHYACFACC